jgi:hypothetical protein
LIVASPDEDASELVSAMMSGPETEPDKEPDKDADDPRMSSASLLASEIMDAIKENDPEALAHAILQIADLT